jgi:DNA-binding transcriptional LysR family regulator
MTEAQLAAVRAVAEEKSFVRAAQRLLVSQPAISLHVSELESELKLKLFDRAPRATRPTEAGQVLTDYARRIALLRAEALAAMEDLRGARRGKISIGATLTIAAYLLPGLLGRFRRAFPAIEVDVTVANTQQVQRNLKDGLLDVALTEGEPGGTEFKSTIFAHDELIAIVPPGHELLKQSSVTAAMFTQYPVIAREPGSGTRLVAERALASRGIVIKPHLALPQAEAIMHCVAEGLGVAIISRLAAGREVESGRLVHIPLSDLTIRRPLYVERSIGRTPSPALEALLPLINPLLPPVRSLQ